MKPLKHAHDPLFPALKSAIESPMPDLLLRRHPQTGEWGWKRTGKGYWHGRFATQEDACADAEACGMPKPYRVKIVPFGM